MASSGNQWRDIAVQYPVGDGLDRFRKRFFEFVAKAPSKPSFNDIAISATTDQEAKHLIFNLFSTILRLRAARRLPAHRGSSHKFLFQDLCSVLAEYPDLVSTEAIGILLEHVIEQPDNEESMWSAVYELFIPVTPPRSKSISPTMIGDRFVSDLYDAWRSPYFKDPLIALQQQMQHCIDDPSAYYAKTLVFVQSSGMGKSRLADAFGESCPMINFILRENEGYPPGDSEILDFMCEKPPKSLSDTVSKSLSKPKSDEDRSAFDKRRTVAIWNHSVAVGLLKTSFEAFNTWVENRDPTEMTLEDLAAIRHKEMAPLDPKEKTTEDMGDGRSQYRIDFCQMVARKAPKIAYSLAMQDSWRKRFVQENESTVRESIEGSRHIESLKNVAEKLICNLKKFRKETAVNPLLVVVFDEATNLFSNTSSDDIDTGRYVALNRVLSCLRKLPIWFFMLSTEPRVEKLLPAEKVAAAAGAEGIDRWSNPTGRRPPSFTSSQTDDCKRLRLFPPFVSFRLDVEDRKRMREPKSKAEELSKPMTDFLKAEHIAMFGRPLWLAYNGPDMLHKVAEWKLLGGRRNSRFDPEDKHQVLAALSFRLSLDVCVENPVSLDLVRTAVNSHLRIVISMDQRTGVLGTATPSEPVLALAAMRLLCQGNNWTTSIKTLTRELLQQGLVAKGVKGELFARLVMILASDQVRLDPISQEGVQASEEGDQESEEEDLAFERDQSPEENLASKDEYSVKSTFMVYDFLKSLFAEKHHTLIQGIPEQILEAKMNFTHFVAATEHLSPTVFPDLCHDLLRRNAALQLCENQATYDQLIPIYFGNDQKPFDPSQCGVVLIQNKNQKRATSLYSIFKEQFVTVRPEAGSPSKRLKTQKATKASIREGPYFVFNNMANPILFLLFDTGVRAVKSALLEVSHSVSDKDPQVWAVHSRGHTPETFGCLKKMDTAGNVKALFASVMQNVGIYADIARENVGFGRLARQFRYAKIEGDTKEVEKNREENIALDKLKDIGEDKDTLMPDA